MKVIQVNKQYIVAMSSGHTFILGKIVVTPISINTAVYVYESRVYAGVSDLLLVAREATQSMLKFMLEIIL